MAPGGGLMFDIGGDPGTERFLMRRSDYRAPVRIALDGFVAGPNHEMGWMTGFTFRPGLVEKYVATTGAVLGGRDGWDAFPDPGSIYGGGWQGPLFVLTQPSRGRRPAPGVTFLDCDVAEAVRVGLEAAAGKNLEVLSSTIGRQLLEQGLIEELDLHVVPILLGDGIRPYDNPGGAPHPARAGQRRRPRGRRERAIPPDRPQGIQSGPKASTKRVFQQTGVF